MEILEKAINAIKATIETDGGELSVKMKVRHSFIHASHLNYRSRSRLVTRFPLFNSDVASPPNSPKQSLRQKIWSSQLLWLVLDRRTQRFQETKRKIQQTSRSSYKLHIVAHRVGKHQRSTRTCSNKWRVQSAVNTVL